MRIALTSASLGKRQLLGAEGAPMPDAQDYSSAHDMAATLCSRPLPSGMFRLHVQSASIAHDMTANGAQVTPPTWTGQQPSGWRMSLMHWRLQAPP